MFILDNVERTERTEMHDNHDMYDQNLQLMTVRSGRELRLSGFSCLTSGAASRYPLGILLVESHYLCTCMIPLSRDLPVVYTKTLVLHCNRLV